MPNQNSLEDADGHSYSLHVKIFKEGYLGSVVYDGSGPNHPKFICFEPSEGMELDPKDVQKIGLAMERMRILGAKMLEGLFCPRDSR